VVVHARGKASDMVARESKSSPDDFTKAGPSIQLDAKQCRDASILNLQVVSVFPQELHAIKLLPECLVTTRKAREAGVKELLGELLALLDGGRVDYVVLVLLHERLVVRAAVLGREPRRLARLGLQLRQLRPQRRHGIC
jgi:hypothetical protein